MNPFDPVFKLKRKTMDERVHFEFLCVERVQMILVINVNNIYTVFYENGLLNAC